MANRNSNLIHAKKAKNDEFYTQLSDIENELRHYKAAFRGKTVLCNCDDPRVSNFTRYFLYNFDNLGLKRLISTCYRNSQPDLFSERADDKACYLVYKDDQKKAVIDTIFKGFPLNVMYWVKNPDGRYEVLDGQQRTISFCSYVSGDFSIPDGNGNAIYFPNLPQDRKDAFLDYKLSIYICEGTDSEKLDWFRIVNIAGARLTDQELRNAVYAGPWLSDAKRYFSRTGCAAYQIGSRYMTGQPIRQDYLETALKWIVDSDEVKAKGISSIEEYIGRYQDERNANELWLYFKGVIDWVDTLFGARHYRKEMDGLDWGILYNRYHDGKYDADTLEKEVARLTANEDVTSKKGIYAYVLGGMKKEDERLLSIRKFLERDKRSAYEKQNGICPKCGNHFDYKDMQADHIKPWSKGGRTVADNCQMLCAKCNREKTDI